MTSDDELPAGWLTQFRRGFVAAFVLLAAAILLVAIPTFVAWLAPGADSTSAGSALRAALLITLAGNRGGIVLDGTPISLTPLLVTGFLCWLVAVNARRVETDVSFAGLVVGYPTAVAIATHWAHLGTSRMPVRGTVVAAFLLVLATGAFARYGPLVWQRMADRWQAVARATAGAVASYLGCGALLAAGMLAEHFANASDLQSRLMSGAAGLPIALVGLAAVPNAVLCGVGFLSGAGFDIGRYTHIAPLVMHRGTLPAFPLLAALPEGTGQPSQAAQTSWVGWAACLATAVLAGLVGHRLLASKPTTDLGDFGQAALDRIVVAAGVGITLGGLGWLATGSAGTGALSHVGVTDWLVAGCVTGLMTTSSIAILGVSRFRSRLHSDGISAVLVPFTRVADAADDVDHVDDIDELDEVDDDRGANRQPAQNDGSSADRSGKSRADTADTADRAARRLRSTG